MNLIKIKRENIINAYRNYQAAVNYGEFQRDQRVDNYIWLVYQNNQAAINNPCTQLQYFMGKVTFANSGLVKILQH